MTEDKKREAYEGEKEFLEAVENLDQLPACPYLRQLPNSAVLSAKGTKPGIYSKGDLICLKMIRSSSLRDSDTYYNCVIHSYKYLNLDKKGNFWFRCVGDCTIEAKVVEEPSPRAELEPHPGARD